MGQLLNILQYKFNWDFKILRKKWFFYIIKIGAQLSIPKISIIQINIKFQDIIV